MPKEIKIKKAIKTDEELIADAQNLIESKRLSDGEVILDTLLKKNCTHPDLYHLKGVVYFFKKDYKNGQYWIEKALKKNKGQWLYLKNLSVLKRHIGDTDAAIRHLEEALKTKKDDYEMYRFLVESKKFTERPDFLDMLEKAAKNPQLNPKVKAHIYFAAGKIYDDLKDYDNAFKNYHKGNIATGHKMDLTLVEKETAQFIYAYPKSYIDRVKDLGILDAKPVFVLGMPRSGTSLMEQLIVSHPKGAGVGELTDINRISDSLDKSMSEHGGYHMVLNRLKGDFRKGYGQSYLDRVKEISGIDDPTIRIVDKQPINFRRMGLITEMFPNAKIIHMRRDARDTCLSCYFQYFISMQHYSFDLTSLGRYYRMYERIMEHWQQVMPDRFITVDYENLINNFEQEARRVINYLELDWDDACLTPHKAKNIVQTASAWQVRQPLYASSQNRWKNYEKHLGTLFDVLNAGR